MKHRPADLWMVAMQDGEYVYPYVKWVFTSEQEAQHELEAVHRANPSMRTVPLVINLQELHDKTFMY